MQFLKTKLRQFLGLKSIVQLKRFLIIGAGSTVISYTIFVISVRLLSLHYLIANIFAFVVSVCFSYNCNKRWSFGGAHHKQSHLVEYLGVYLTSLAASAIILRITIDFLGIIPEISFVISLCFTTCINFLGIKFIVFKK